MKCWVIQRKSDGYYWSPGGFSKNVVRFYHTFAGARGVVKNLPRRVRVPEPWLEHFSVIRFELENGVEE